MSRDIVWGRRPLSKIFNDAFEKAKAEQASFDHDQVRWDLIHGADVQKLIRMRNETLDDALKVSYQKQIDAIVPQSIPEPGPVCTEMREKGYDWDARGVYESTAINGTDWHLFSISPSDPTPSLWMNPIQCALLVLAKTSKYKGWRTIDVEGGCHGLRVTLYGGKKPGWENIPSSLYDLDKKMNETNL